MTLRFLAFGPPVVREGDAVVSGAAAQPRRLALLALLARSGDRGITREKLVGILWPDEEEERGRRNLTHALYALRRDLGSEEAIIGSKDLRLNPEVLRADVTEFVEARSAGDLEGAAAIYAGPFLDGFHLPGAADFESWVDRERQSLSEQYGAVLEQLALKAEGAGDHKTAIRWWRRLATQDPLDARIAQGLMQALARTGDIPGALKHARVYEILVKEELELPPDREVVALAESLRAGTRDHGPPPIRAPVERGDAAPSGPEGAAPSITEQRPLAPPEPTVLPAGPAEESILPVEDRRPTRRASDLAWYHRPRLRWAFLAAGGALLTLILAVMFFRATRERVPLLAVGTIVDHTGSQLSGALRDMLATNLARGPGMRVISTARLYEFLAEGDTSVGAVSRAARAAGASEVIEGALFSRPDGTLRLDLRRVALPGGEVAAGFSVEGPDPYALVDRGTERLLAQAGQGRAIGSQVAEVTTGSLTAYRFFEEGLRARARGDVRAAESFFEAAVREDSTFALATYYLADYYTVDLPRRYELMERALRLADGTTDRERLIIRAGWAWLATDPSMGAIADTLRTRFPDEMLGWLMTGNAALMSGDFLASLAPYDTLIVRDSVRISTKAATRCFGCEGLHGRVQAYLLLDSLAAAEREAHRWARLVPTDPAAWLNVEGVLVRRGRYDEAEAALRRAFALSSFGADAPRFMASSMIHAGRTGEAERLLQGWLMTAPPAYAGETWWQIALARREGGDPQGALAAARRSLALAQGHLMHPTHHLVAQLLAEAGRPREGALLFDSLSRYSVPGQPRSRLGRQVAWALVHEADAWAVAGDTARLRALIDPLQREGNKSGLARDQRLHHHARGLLLQLRGDHIGAVREFEAAIYSPTDGYTRTNLALARSLHALGRNAEAAEWLRQALDGWYEGSGLYVSRRELKAALRRVTGRSPSS